MNLFKEHKYLIIRNAISFELANFAFNYFLMKRDATEWMHKNNYVSEYTPGFGTWKDEQIPNTFSCYGDTFMETLMMKVLPIMEKYTTLKLLPTYSYARLYKKGDELLKHKDRYSCEISATMNLGGDLWPIFLDYNKKEIKINLKPGDVLLYKGSELEHWREPFKGSLCGQVFFHYNDKNGPFKTKNIFDGRSVLGLPADYKNVKL